jgi:hypothetical protein
MIGYAATTTFVMTLASLAAASARESDAIDWAGLYKQDDCMLEIALGSAAPTTADQQGCYLYFYGSTEGTSFDSPCTGADAGVVLGTNSLKGPLFLAVPVGTVYRNFSIPSVALFFGGVLPKKWGIVVENRTNGALLGTEAAFIKMFTPVFVTT